MSTIADHCKHGAVPRELLDFAEIYARENLRAYYCQDCLKKNSHRSTTQLIFNHLCDRLNMSDGTSLSSVPEEPKVVVSTVDGADAEPSTGLEPGERVLRPGQSRLRLPKLNLKRHLRTPAQRRKEEQRMQEVRLVEAMRSSQRRRGTQATEMLVRHGLDVRNITGVRSSVTGSIRSRPSPETYKSYSWLARRFASGGLPFHRRIGTSAQSILAARPASMPTTEFSGAPVLEMPEAVHSKSRGLSMSLWNTIRSTGVSPMNSRNLSHTPGSPVRRSPSVQDRLDESQIKEICL